MKRIAAIGVVALAVAIAPVTRAQYTADFQTNVISGVTSNWNGDYYVGSNTVFDELQVTSGAMLSNGFGYIGYGSGGSNNDARVNGSGSVWLNSQDLNIGYQGGSNNALFITGSGRVGNHLGNIGSSGNGNTVIVSDSGSVWSNSSTVFVGVSGGNGNSLVVSNGGRVTGAFGSVGSTGNGNRALVSGSGSVWSNAGNLIVGSSSGSSNSLVVENSARLINNTGTVGNNGSANNAIVRGTGTLWQNSGTLSVGNGGSGNWVIASNGATVSVGIDLNIGRSGRSNSVLITDSGTTWTNGEDIAAGYRGNGANSLVISNGAVLASRYGFVGDSDNGSWAIIDGVGSTWICQSNMYVGCPCDSPSGGNSNMLVIKNGGKLITGVATFNGFDGSIGYDTAGNTVLVTGTGSVWSNSYCALFVGGYGLGVGTGNSLVISNGGMVVQSLPMMVGFLRATSNSLVVSDGGTASTGSMTVYPTNSVRLAGGNLTTINGSEISGNASLTGCGTVTGPVVIDPGGIILADCTSGTLTFTGAVTNNGTMRALNGGVLEGYDTVVNNGTIDIVGGSTNFHGAFINNGVVIDASAFRIVNIAREGNDIRVTWNAVVGHTNVVQSAANVAGSYSDVSPNIVLPGGGGVTTNYLDAGGATNAAAKFYHIRLVP